MFVMKGIVISYQLFKFNVLVAENDSVPANMVVEALLVFECV